MPPLSTQATIGSNCYDCGHGRGAGFAGGLRGLTRRTVRAEIANKATELFLQKGVDETTIEQIAAAVGTSGGNVFRDFPPKADQVLAGILEQGFDVACTPPDR